jgi:hypothetical protein
MINTGQLAQWLTDRASATALAPKIVPGPRLPEFVKGDTIGVVTLMPGAGLVLEGLFDNPAFQLELVGRERDRDELEAAFTVLDQALVWMDLPSSLWGVRVVQLDRVGGGPAATQQDEHQRISYACSYWAMVSLL